MFKRLSNTILLLPVLTLVSGCVAPSATTAPDTATDASVADGAGESHGVLRVPYF